MRRPKKKSQSEKIIFNISHYSATILEAMCDETGNATFLYNPENSAKMYEKLMLCIKVGVFVFLD